MRPSCISIFACASFCLQSGIGFNAPQTPVLQEVTNTGKLKTFKEVRSIIVDENAQNQVNGLTNGIATNAAVQQNLQNQISAAQFNQNQNQFFSGSKSFGQNNAATNAGSAKTAVGILQSGQQFSGLQGSQTQNLQSQIQNGFTVQQNNNQQASHAYGVNTQQGSGFFKGDNDGLLIGTGQQASSNLIAVRADIPSTSVHGSFVPTQPAFNQQIPSTQSLPQPTSQSAPQVFVAQGPFGIGAAGGQTTSNFGNGAAPQQTLPPLPQQFIAFGYDLSAAGLIKAEYCEKDKMIKAVSVCLAARYVMRTQLKVGKIGEACSMFEMFHKCVQSALLYSQCPMPTFVATSWGLDYEESVKYMDKICPAKCNEQIQQANLLQQAQHPSLFQTQQPQQQSFQQGNTFTPQVTQLQQPTQQQASPYQNSVVG